MPNKTELEILIKSYNLPTTHIKKEDGKAQATGFFNRNWKKGAIGIAAIATFATLATLTGGMFAIAVGIAGAVSAAIMVGGDISEKEKSRAAWDEVDAAATQANFGKINLDDEQKNKLSTAIKNDFDKINKQITNANDKRSLSTVVETVKAYKKDWAGLDPHIKSQISTKYNVEEKNYVDMLINHTISSLTSKIKKLVTSDGDNEKQSAPEIDKADGVAITSGFDNAAKAQSSASKEKVADKAPDPQISKPTPTKIKK